MFGNALFDQWLDEQANLAMQKVVKGQPLSLNDTVVLALKGQASYLERMRKQ